MRKQKYFTEEERKKAQKEASKRFRDKHKDEEDYKATHRAYTAKWRKNNPEYGAEYRLTQKGRAFQLLNGYRNSDSKYNRGECTLTADYIVEHIFTQPCAHCGETDWRKIGCNRLDNSLPHTPDNVEPCCWECNCELHNPKKQVYQYSLDGLLVAIWPSVAECNRNGYNLGAVAACCRGELKRYKGHRWSYEPL